MKIGELSKVSGFSKDTIRYYQKLGLFSSHVKQGENNYRVFSSEALEILKLIEESKFHGFTLKQSKNLLQLKNDKTQQLNLMKNYVAEKIEHNKNEIKRLEELTKRLKVLDDEIDNCVKHCAKEVGLKH